MASAWWRENRPSAGQSSNVGAPFSRMELIVNLRKGSLG